VHLSKFLLQKPFIHKTSNVVNIPPTGQLTTSSTLKQQQSQHALTRAGAHVCEYTRDLRGYCGTMYISTSQFD
ncbi:MAG: hypothetical protein WC179_07135, partial [Candidatus Cloacimonadaceae bacterium]